MLFYMCFCIIYTGNPVSQNPFEQFGVRADPKQSCARTGRQSGRAVVTACQWRQLRVRGRHNSAGGSLWVSSSQLLALLANSDAGTPGTHRCERQSCCHREPAVVCGRLSQPPLWSEYSCGMWLAYRKPANVHMSPEPELVPGFPLILQLQIWTFLPQLLLRLCKV